MTELYCTCQDPDLEVQEDCVVCLACGLVYDESVENYLQQQWEDQHGV